KHLERRNLLRCKNLQLSTCNLQPVFCAPSSTIVARFCTILHHFAPRCTVMHHDMPSRARFAP
ncbi:MAG TPA: hypothetical protein VMX57_01340, partial [Planctomycetota bacterium]|nr:hypothetical protein [Planctomycetota bacterium]